MDVTDLACHTGLSVMKLMLLLIMRREKLYLFLFTVISLKNAEKHNDCPVTSSLVLVLQCTDEKNATN